MGREYERKYRGDAAVIQAIQEKYAPFTPITMETTYYDTPDLKLRLRHWTLRKRLENGVSVCTVKIPLPDGSRGEWETVSASLMAGVLALVSQGAPEELLDLTAGGVTPFCGARFTRLAREISLPQGSVELALDQGCLLGGGKERPLCEIEVELKSGEDGVAAAFAEDLAREFGLVPELKSKLARAMELAL